MTQTRATTFGFCAVLLWSLLAILTVKTTPVPPFQLSAMTFLIGGCVGLIWGGRKTWSVLSTVPLQVWLLGLVGLFGYHFLYFSALRAAPPAQAGLIAYLWPLLIVLFSGLLPGERLKLGHVVGAAISFAGAAWLLLGGDGGFEVQFAKGYGLAAFCAIIWSGYSVISRTFGAVPTQSVTGFCLAAAVLSLVSHVFLEETLWPETTLGWLAVIGLGIGPVGLAFYTWDIGMKKGNIQLLGVASYAAPLLSTLILVVAGIAAPTMSLLGAAMLISVGAILAARTR